MADGDEGVGHFRGGDDVAVRLVAEIQPDAGREAPRQRQLVDADRAAAAVHGRGVVPGCIHVRAAVGGDLQVLGGPALGVRQLARIQAREHGGKLRRPGLVIHVGDLGKQRGRIRRHAVF